MKFEFTTTRVRVSIMNEVKHTIIGTPLNVSQFVEEAIIEKLERDNLRTWIETPQNLSPKKDQA